MINWLHYAWHCLTSLKKRPLWGLLKGIYYINRDVNLFNTRKKNGEFLKQTFVPPALFISVTDWCNLRCIGCWAYCKDEVHTIDQETLHQLILEAQANHCHFVGILGGEPLFCIDQLLDLFHRHQKVYFQLFTNGILLTDTICAQLAQLGNVTVLVSLEGMEEGMKRRGRGGDTYKQALLALDFCRRHGLFFGVATSVSRDNFCEVVHPTFVTMVREKGAHYLWYYIYRPIGSDPHPEWALTRDDILELRKFIVNVRKKCPLLIIDAYWDADGKPLCPAVEGLSYHISPKGWLEPCPVIQFSDAQVVKDPHQLSVSIKSSKFLRVFRERVPQYTQGCILLENPQVLYQWITKIDGVQDTSNRGTGLTELEQMSPKSSHDLGEDRVPEDSWIYRQMKKKFFLGLGTYG